MTSIRQVCVGVAIAGAVVGAGSAVGTAVADAAPSSPDSSSSASAGPKANAPARARATAPGSAASNARASVRKVNRPNVPPPAAPAASTVRSALPAAASVPARRTAPSRGLVALLPVLPTPAPARSRTASAVPTVLLSPTPPAPTHVLLIGTDGTNLDKILADPYYSTGGFKTVMDQGITSATSIVGHTTISGPSWTTILTGVWDNKSGVINNLFNPKPYDKWPTVINQLEYAYGDNVSTAVFADWQYINDIADAGGWKADKNVSVAFDTSWATTDAEVTAQTIDWINNHTTAGSSSFIFSYQVQVDEAGHAYGGGSPEYAQAVTNVSNNIDDIMSAVNAWNTAHPDEEWTVIVTTDHGHQQSKGFGHGFQSPNETSSFIMIDLAGDDSTDGQQNQAYQNTDITPTIVNLFGAPTRTDFDGVPLTTKNSSNVKPVDLVQSLNNAIDMYGYPNIGVDLALGTRTVFASVPYFLDGFVTDITAQLQGIAEKNIFLISTLAEIAKVVVQITGDVGVAATQVVARVVAHLTGAGTIPPSEGPLPPPPAAGSPSPAQLLMLPTAALA